MSERPIRQRTRQVFVETARIIQSGGMSVFVVGDRAQDEALKVEIGAGHTKLGNS